MRGLAKAHRSTRNNHLHRNARLGSCRSDAMTVGISVAKEAVETGRVRVSKQTHTREVAVEEDLLRKSAEIETIPIGRQIFEMPSVRHEGETVIVPIVEEILHT